jgi:hypothetical protein
VGRCGIGLALDDNRICMCGSMGIIDILGSRLLCAMYLTFVVDFIIFYIFNTHSRHHFAQNGEKP